MISKSSYDFLMDTNVIVSDLFYRMTGLSHICICCFKSVLIFFIPHKPSPLSYSLANDIAAFPSKAHSVTTYLAIFQSFDVNGFTASCGTDFYGKKASQVCFIHKF